MPAGQIKLNPAIFNDARSARSVAWNEGLRLWMEDHGYEPETQPTPEQQAALANTAYADDPAAMAKTVLARIITRDTSAPNPTPEQRAEAYKLLKLVEDTLAHDDPDLETLDLLSAEFEPDGQEGLESPQEGPSPEAAALTTPETVESAPAPEEEEAPAVEQEGPAPGEEQGLEEAEEPPVTPESPPTGESAAAVPPQ